MEVNRRKFAKKKQIFKKQPEYSEDWQTERCYINAGSIKVQKEILFNVA